jgi:hypothetical protein
MLYFERDDSGYMRDKMEFTPARERKILKKIEKMKMPPESDYCVMMREINWLRGLIIKREIEPEKRIGGSPRRNEPPSRG